jgi:hypothetical protein
MKRPPYTSAQPNGLRRFPASPKHEPLPPHPAPKYLLERLCHQAAIEHLSTKGPWSEAAYQVWETLLPLRNAAQQAQQSPAR